MEGRMKLGVEGDEDGVGADGVGSVVFFGLFLVCIDM